MRCLIAGPDPSLRSALAILLARRLAIDEFAAAADLDELRAQAAAWKPGVVLLDWALPGLQDGKGLAELRAAAPAATVVALSIQPEDRDLALACGAAAFVYKAESPDEVVRIIEQTLKGLN